MKYRAENQSRESTKSKVVLWKNKIYKHLRKDTQKTKLEMKQDVFLLIL